MLSDVTSNTITALKTLTEFAASPDTYVVRGEFGKLNTTKEKGVIVVADFKPPRAFGEQEEALVKQVPFVNNLFVYAGHKKTQADCEDDCMDLCESVLTKILNEEFYEATSVNSKYYRWEITDIEWIERSASLSVIAVELTMNYQV